MRFNKKIGNEKGMAIVEFAMITPILAVLLFGITEFGFAFYRQQIITSSAREAARAGIRASDPQLSGAEVKGKALTYLSNAGLDATEASISVSGAAGGTGDALTVQVDYPTNFSVLSSLIGSKAGAVKDRIVLTARVVMEHE
jgi:Flp pilus assembly protein TadG